MPRIPIHFCRETAYIDRQMTKPDPGQISSVVLLSLCARDREDSILWAELLRRTAPRIKQFIRGTLRQSSTGTAFSHPVELQESDLFQSAIMKLVENDCAAMRRFSGTTDEELMAYLAVITRSVVRDCLRRQRARKRPSIRISIEPLQPEGIHPPGARLRIDPSSAERGLLAREIRDLSERSLSSLEGESSDRDRLIFELYFFHDLSLNQVAQCRGINLSKAGVEKVICRLTERLRAAATIGVSEATLQ
jgi:RNA polymerase sigma factor (sigma-70 family)